MRKHLKDMFLDIVEEWDKHWKDKVGFYDSLGNYLKINTTYMNMLLKREKRKKTYRYFNDC